MEDWRADVSLADRVSPFEFVAGGDLPMCYTRTSDVEKAIRFICILISENGSRWLPRGSNEQTFTTFVFTLCRFVPVLDCLCLLACGCSHNIFVWSPTVTTRSEPTLWHPHNQKRKEALSVVSILHACFWVRHYVAGKLPTPHCSLASCLAHEPIPSTLITELLRCNAGDKWPTTTRTHPSNSKPCHTSRSRGYRCYGQPQGSCLGTGKCGRRRFPRPMDDVMDIVIYPGKMAERLCPRR